MNRTLRIYDPLLFWLSVLATGLGLVFIFDAGYARSLQKGESGLPSEFKNQLAFIALAAAAAWFAGRFPTEKWKKWSKMVWIANLLLLVAVMLVGHRLNGAKRWLGVGGASIQPAEFAKLAAIVYLAGYFADRKPLPKKKSHQLTQADRIQKFKRCLPALWVFLAVILIEVEPDMGTGAVIAATGFAMFYPAGVSKRSMMLALAVAAIGGSVAVYKEPYRLQRFIDHPNRWSAENIDDSEFQTVQAELAISSGGVVGAGLGAGRAKQVLPATTTDFIMATAGEETEMLGALAVLAVLAGIVGRLLYLAMHAKNRFNMLVLYGVGFWLGIQTCVNVMMANAMLPAIGIPLPFISSGGSSLVALWMAIGLCQATQAPVQATAEERVPEAKKPNRSSIPQSQARGRVVTTTMRARGQ